MVTGGRNTGRIGVIVSKEKHPGSFDIVHVKDANGHAFATRQGYVFIIGKFKNYIIDLATSNARFPFNVRFMVESLGGKCV